MNMNEEMLKDQISQLQTDLHLYKKYKQLYEELRNPCLRIYYGRIGMSESAVLSGIHEIETFFREPNLN